jgi:hypothetical protein
MSTRAKRLLRELMDNFPMLDEAQYRRPVKDAFAQDFARLCGDMTRVTADFERALRRVEEEMKTKANVSPG